MWIRHASGWRDAIYVWRLRNESAVRRASRDQGVVWPWAHALWWLTTSERVFVFSADDPTERLGVGRIAIYYRDDLAANIAHLSIVVDPRWRGRGYGRRMIDGLVCEAELSDCVACEAEIRHDNVASRRAFERAGFLQLRSVDGVIVMGRAM